LECYVPILNYALRTWMYKQLLKLYKPCTLRFSEAIISAICRKVTILILYQGYLDYVYVSFSYVYVFPFYVGIKESHFFFPIWSLWDLCRCIEKY
jgi:hypothetical protein